MKLWLLRIGVSILLYFLLVTISAVAAQTPKQNQNDRSNSSKDVGPDRDRIVAIVNDKISITEKEVDDAIGAQLYNLQERIYALRKKALDDIVSKLVLKQEAASRNISVDELRRQLTPRTVDAQQSEIDKNYSHLLGTLENMNEDEAKLRIRLDIENRLKLDAYKEGVAKLVAKAKIETLLEPTASAASLVSTDGPSKGSTEAPVTILEFSDFQCPYCKQAAAAIKPLLDDYGDKVRLIFKHMPLAIHADAFKAAQASVCASDQGKFWEFHDRLFRSSDLSESALNIYAFELGLKIPQFTNCLNSEGSAAVVRRDMQEANRVDIQGTPTFFVNGRIIRGLKSAAEFKNVIDQALKDQRKERKESDTR